MRNINTKPKEIRIKIRKYLRKKIKNVVREQLGEEDEFGRENVGVERHPYEVVVQQLGVHGGGSAARLRAIVIEPSVILVVVVEVD